MSWEKVLKEDEEYFEVRDFTFPLKGFIERIEKVKNYKELYSVIKDLKEEVDYHEFNLKNMLNRQPKSDFPDSEARPEFAREHRGERL